MSNQAFCNTAAVIQKACSDVPQWNAVLDAARQEFSWLKQHFQDDTPVNSGWGHDFVCPKCASQLEFEIAKPFQPGQTYRCPHCGTITSGPVLDEACVYYRRISFASHLLSPALLARLGDQDAKLFIQSFIDHYAQRYLHYPLHGSHVGKGRAMGQSLDEAVWVLHLLQAIHICEFDQSILAHWYHALFEPIYQVIYPQADAIHNIPLWLQAAVGAIGIVFRKPDLLEQALHTPYGILAQISKGYTSDGFWDECSTHYHYYSTEALTRFLLFSHDNPFLIDFLAKAYQIPFTLSQDGYQLPSLNDGWYPLNATMYAPQLILAARILQNHPSGYQLFQQLQQVHTRTPEAYYTVAGLLFGTEGILFGCSTPSERCDVSPVCYASTCLAALRQPVLAILKGSVLRDSHMHQDALSVILPPFSEDLGTPGYAHPLTSSYYRQSIAHNTVLCDDHGQEGFPKSCTMTTAENRATAFVPHLYPGVRGTRTLEAMPHHILDTVTLEADQIHRFTLVFHAVHVVQEQANAGIVPVPAELPQFPELRSILCYPGATTLSLRCDFNGETRTIQVTAAPGSVFYTADFPGNPADLSLRGILCVQTGTKITYQSEYRQ